MHIGLLSRKNSRTILFFNLAVNIFIPHIIDGAASAAHDKSSRCKYRQRVEWGQDSRGCGKSNTPTTRPEQQPRPCANIASSQNIVNYLVLLNRIEANFFISISIGIYLQYFEHIVYIPSISSIALAGMFKLYQTQKRKFWHNSFRKQQIMK